MPRILSAPHRPRPSPLPGLIRLLTCWLALLSLPGWSADTTLTLSPGTPILYPGVGMLELNTRAEATLDEVLDSDPDGWQPVGHKAITRQYTQEVFWYRFDVSHEDAEQQWFFELDWPLLDHVEVYLVGPGRNVIRHWQTGDTRPFAERPIPASSFIFPLPMKERSYEVLFRIQTSSQFYAMPSIYRESQTLDGRQHYLPDRNTSIFRHSLFFGVMAIMILYNLFVLRETRDGSYLAYVAYCGAVTLFHVTLQGWGYQYLWPDSPSFQQVAYPLFAALSYLGALWFVILFLETRKLPAVHRIGLYLCAGWSLFIYLALVFDEAHFTTGSLPLVAGCLVMSLVAPIAAYMTGNRQGLFFLLAWSLPIIGTAANLLMQQGVLEANEFTVFGGQALGIALETVLISLALSYRMKRMQLEAENARIETIRYETEHYVMLEERMKARQRDIESTRMAFHETNKRLANNDKDAVLGLLMNALARQLLGPTQDARLEVAALQARQHDFEQWLDTLLDGADDDIRKTFDEALQQLHEATDMLSSGASRVGDVTNSLAIDEYFRSARSSADIGRLIADSVQVLAVSFPGLSLETHAAEDLTVSCWPSALGVAIHAVLYNACQATAGGGTPHVGINAERGPDGITILVTDSGNGIHPDVVDRIFDPFFTTRDIGMGKGMGLTVAREILRRHGGSISCLQTDAGGTTMSMRVPV